MKRVSNLYNQICSIENLELADQIASKGKAKSKGVIKHRANAVDNLQKLQKQLFDKTFTTSKYSVFKIKDPKVRTIHSLPYYPDRIVHHTIMNVLEPHFMKWFTSNTYSSIKGRGIHLAAKRLKKALLDITGTKYCLKLDITKFYQSINTDLLKDKLRKKIKDADLLWLLDNIVNSAIGLPIGNYLSQYLANFFLTDFDHWIKEVKKVTYYFRYADDIVILSGCKQRLHKLLAEIKQYLETLQLKVKSNYQIFPIAKRGIDFLGYVFFHTHTLIRKSIKKRYARMLARSPSQKSIASYNGWLKHCNSKNLQNKLLKTA